MSKGRNWKKTPWCWMFHFISLIESTVNGTGLNKTHDAKTECKYGHIALHIVKHCLSTALHIRRMSIQLVKQTYSLIESVAGSTLLPTTRWRQNSPIAWANTTATLQLKVCLFIQCTILAYLHLDFVQSFDYRVSAICDGLLEFCTHDSYKLQMQYQSKQMPI